MFAPQNNNYSGVNVNTRLYTSYSDTCMISLGAWNEKLSLKIHPVKGVNAEGLRQYAQTNTEIIQTSLTVDNTTALLEGINKKIMPVIDEDEPLEKKVSVSVTMGMGENRKVLSIVADGKNVYLELYIRVSDDGKADENNKITHKFNKKEYMTSYNPADGSGEVEEINADFKNFIKKLESVYEISAAIPHAINYSNALKNSFSANRQSDNQNGGESSSYSAPVSNYTGENMGDFLPFN